MEDLRGSDFPPTSQGGERGSMIYLGDLDWIELSPGDGGDGDTPEARRAHDNPEGLRWEELKRLQGAALLLLERRRPECHEVLIGFLETLHVGKDRVGSRLGSTPEGLEARPLHGFYSETAKEIGVAEATVKNRLRSALKFIAEFMRPFVENKFDNTHEWPPNGGQGQ